MEPRNLFADLGLGIEATAEAVKAAYRRLAMELHPDRLRATPSDDPRGDIARSAHDRMVLVNAAYAVLSVDKEREQLRDALRARQRVERNGIGAVLTEEAGWVMPDTHGRKS